LFLVVLVLCAIKQEERREERARRGLEGLPRPCGGGLEGKEKEEEEG